MSISVTIQYIILMFIEMGRLVGNFWLCNFLPILFHKTSYILTKCYTRFTSYVIISATSSKQVLLTFTIDPSGPLA